MTHIPVLLNEVIELLNPKSGENFIDGTFGNGGHSGEILKRIQPNGELLAIDWNKEAVQICRSSTSAICVEGNFADLPAIVKKKEFSLADGLLLDLGVSSEELEVLGRGFSFQKDEPLLMTYNDNQRPLYQLLAEMNRKELEEIIRQYGEERFARRIADSIVSRCRAGKMKTSRDLTEAVLEVYPNKRGHIHPATKTFMALRIYANYELENLENVLNNLEKIMNNKGSRVAIISFHSLEDRLVKRKFRELAKASRAELLTKKPTTPSKEEIEKNPRSRSAKLRVIQFNF